MYCPGGEVGAITSGGTILFCTVRRRLGGWRVHSIMNCPGGKVGGAGQAAPGGSGGKRGGGGEIPLSFLVSLFFLC